ncbi:MarR family winged helix-turn-helix transcriptional regulator [Streptomyces griseocarneus]|uniref:MarR family winged helix-turn-helix transcriptional regulator n=1 Tax=Streptomyces griseocarneus TaxID=51201 RepID=UPI00167C8CDD|nr:MarR family transcriptional regulator [Streptomyces griseocarneus]MBZ6474998.1 MarR family transcriptional regulator [Streptomyces griseocarneus]GHG62867.1 MarR family transcriptional regulator [Streptomyces griseocarneus]
MKHVHKPGLARDPDGFLYDPGVRDSMQAFAAGDDTLALETAAAVRSASQAVDRLRSHGAGGRGLSAGALDVLARLSTATDQGLSIGELARAAGVSSRNVTGLVDTLERDGLAQRVQDQHDRRSVRATITPAGLDWLDNFRQPTQRAMSAVFQNFTEDELARFRDLCLRMVENQQRIEQYLNAPRRDEPPTS